MKIVLDSSDQSLSNTSSQSSYCNQWPLGMLLVRCYFSEGSIVQYVIFNNPAGVRNSRQKAKRGHCSVHSSALLQKLRLFQSLSASCKWQEVLWFHQERLTDQHYSDKRASSLHPLPWIWPLPFSRGSLLLTMCKFHKLHFTTPCFLTVLARKEKNNTQEISAV